MLQCQALVNFKPKALRCGEGIEIWPLTGSSSDQPPRRICQRTWKLRKLPALLEKRWPAKTSTQTLIRLPSNRHQRVDFTLRWGTALTGGQLDVKRLLPYHAFKMRPNSPMRLICSLCPSGLKSNSSREARDIHQLYQWDRHNSNLLCQMKTRTLSHLRYCRETWQSKKICSKKRLRSRKPTLSISTWTITSSRQLSQQTHQGKTPLTAPNIERLQLYQTISLHKENWAFSIQSKTWFSTRRYTQREEIRTIWVTPLIWIKVMRLSLAVRIRAHRSISADASSALTIYAMSLPKCPRMFHRLSRMASSSSFRPRNLSRREGKIKSNFSSPEMRELVTFSRNRTIAKSAKESSICTRSRFTQSM